MSTRVKGIKYGTMQQYLAMRSPDDDTLYFITDKGLLYRGRSIVVPVNVVEAALSATPPSGVHSETGTKYGASFTITTYGSDPANPDVLRFDVYTKAGVDAIRTVLEQALNTHRLISSGVYADGKAYTAMEGDAAVHHYGHVRLTDNVNMTTETNQNWSAASDGAAVTPYGVRAAIEAAVGGIGGAMVFKGTIGDAAAYSTSATYAVGAYCTHSSKLYKCTTAIASPEAWNANHWTEIGRTVSTLPTNSYEAGWTYRVVAPGTYAGKSCEDGDLIIATTNGPASGNTVVNAHWTVAQNNIDGAVTAQADLDADTLTLGNGGRTVKKLSNSTYGKYLRIGKVGTPEWLNHSLSFANCQTEEATATKTVVPVDTIEKLVTGAILAVNFKNAAGANALLLVNQTDETAHAIVHKKANPSGGYNPALIASGTILAGDTATFMYDSSTVTIGETAYTGVWHLIAVDHLLAKVALSGSYVDLPDKPTKLSQFTNDIIRYGTCSTASAATMAVTAAGFTLQNGNMVAVKFTNTVPAAGKINVNSTGAKNIMHRGSALTANTILGGDTATFVYDGTSYHLLSIDCPVDTTPTENSNNLITSGGVFSAINSAVSDGLARRNFYGRCQTGASVAAKQALSGGMQFNLAVGALVTVKFDNDVSVSSATLSLSSDGTTWTTAKPINYNNAALEANVILAGDTVTFMYDGSVFNLIAFAYEGLKWETME